MQFIDVNCMIGEWKFKNLRFSKKEQLISEMQRLGISKSVVFSSRSWQCDIKTGNDTIINETEGFRHRLIPAISLTPNINQEFGGKEAISKYIIEKRVGAVRLFPTEHNYTLYPWNIGEMFSMLEELQIPVLLEGNPAYYQQIFELSNQFRSLDIILLKVGYRGLRVIYSLFDHCPNIRIDTSTFITYHGIEDVVKYFGSERLIFGSGMPFIDGGVSVGRLVYADLNEKDKENIAYRNIQDIFIKNKYLKFQEMSQ